MYRKLAGRLVASTWVIPKYNFLHSKRIVLKFDDIVEAHRNLIGLSNAIHPGRIDDFNKFEKEIALKLKFESIIEDLEI